jgi:hypothetical protein
MSSSNDATGLHTMMLFCETVENSAVFMHGFFKTAKTSVFFSTVPVLPKNAVYVLPKGAEAHLGL